jgi:hexosaminidase
MEIFPSPYIHIGGDEASMRVWPKCIKCRERMEQEGFTKVSELQGYLVRRIEEFVRSHGRQIIGWDEILETGVPRTAVIQSWRGIQGGIKANAAGHEVVMSPNSHVYFDYYQDLIRKEPKAVGELTSLRHVYSYEPVAPGMDESLVRGLQANLWCEWIPTCEHAEYMLWPRAFAIAEIGWSPRREKDPLEFRDRADALRHVLMDMGYNTFDLDTESELARSGYRTFDAFERAKKQNN